MQEGWDGGTEAALRDLKECMKGANGDPGREGRLRGELRRGSGWHHRRRKVFSTADGNGVFVTTNGGKVFGGKVF